jgi:hypothetical protein
MNRTALPVELEYVDRHATGFTNTANTVAYNVEAIEIGPTGHVYDYCDCHNMVWNALDLRYAVGPDSYVCPMYI